MASLGMVFDPNSVAPAEPRSFDLLPAGKYVAQIVRSEMRETKAGGQILWLELDILEGQHAGRKVWDRLNLVNANAQAAEIAQRTLSAICLAAGTGAVSDSEQLHCRPMLVSVKVTPPKNGYNASNDVSGYEAVQRQAPSFAQTHRAQGVPATGNPPPPPPPPAAGNTPPWRR